AERVAGLVDVRHHEVDALNRAGFHVRDPRHSGAEDDRAGRPRRGELDHPHGLGYLRVMDVAKPDLLVKSLGAVDIRHRYRDEFEFHINHRGKLGRICDWVLSFRLFKLPIVATGTKTVISHKRNRCVAFREPAAGRTPGTAPERTI